MRGELAPIEQGQDEAVCQEGAELFHEVERQAGTSGAILVQESDLGVEACSDKGCGAIVRQQGIKKGKERIHWVCGRAANASGEVKSGRRQEMLKHAKSLCRCISFHSA